MPDPLDPGKILTLPTWDEVSSGDNWRPVPVAFQHYGCHQRRPQLHLRSWRLWIGRLPSRDAEPALHDRLPERAGSYCTAQLVQVIQQLDPSLDWSTFQLGDFSFGGQLYSVPAGLTSYSTRIDATSSVGVYVDVTGIFDEKTGVVTWTFTSIDPTTLDVPSGNPLEGFLPPDTNAPLGDGWVSYTVFPKASNSTGTVINAQATVFFDQNAPINTGTIFNTMDAVPPASSVSTLPNFSPANFLVNWAGTDDSGGSGIASYNVYVSDDDGPPTLWQTATTQTSATYTGQDGHTYAFYSVATDNAGNVQPTPAQTQTRTTVQALAPTVTIAAVTPTPRNGAVSTLTLTLSQVITPGFDLTDLQVQRRR